MKIVRDNGIYVDVNRAELAQELGVGSRPARRFARRADFEDGIAHRTADGALDEGQALVVNKHRPREHTNARAGIQPMFDRHRGLAARISRVGRLFERNEVAAWLICAKPVPGLALWDVVLGDVDQFLALPDLPLRAIENDADGVLAIEQLHIVE